MPTPFHRAILSSLLRKKKAILMSESRPLTLLCITTVTKKDRTSCASVSAKVAMYFC